MQWVPITEFAEGGELSLAPSLPDWRDAWANAQSLPPKIAGWLREPSEKIRGRVIVYWRSLGWKRRLLLIFRFGLRLARIVHIILTGAPDPIAIVWMAAELARYLSGTLDFDLDGIVIPVPDIALYAAA